MAKRLVLGTIVLIIGVVVLVFSHQQIQEAQTLAGQAGRAISGQRQSEYQIFSIARIAGGVFIVIGGLLSASGLFGSSEQTTSTPSKDPSTETHSGTETHSVSQDSKNKKQQSSTSKQGIKILLAGVGVFLVGPIVVIAVGSNVVGSVVWGLGVILMLLGGGRFMWDYLQ
jgi:uncharacterized membrane protein